MSERLSDPRWSTDGRAAPPADSIRRRGVLRSSAPLQISVAVLTAVLVGAAVRPALAVEAPLWPVAKELVVGVLFVIAGLAGWARRPGSRTGPMMTGAGLVWLTARVLVFNDVNSFVFTVGLVLVLVPIAFVAHLAVAFPSGRITSVLERGVVVSSYVVILLGVAFLDVGDCQGCPTNLLAVDGRDGPGRVAEIAVETATLLSIAAFVAILAWHWRRGTPATKRTLVPVLPTAWLYATVSATFILVDLGVPWRPGRVLEDIEYGAILAIPIAFLGGLLRSRLAHSKLGPLVIQLSERPGAELRGPVAKALRDPTVGILYAQGDSGDYCDADGRPANIPPIDDPRTATMIERGGRQIGALVHDRALLDDPVLLDAVGAAAGLAMENHRLHAEVLDRLEEVRSSRVRIVDAGDAARRRVERNLHDGAQQRLVALSMALRMARDRIEPESDPSLAGLLSDASDELHQALRELRELAAGLHPTILTEEGLEAALESLAERSPMYVQLILEAHGRLATPVEVAAYYVVSEALTNSAKHAQASQAVVRTVRTDHRLVVEVTDDGVGGAALRPGSGLEGLIDRIEALGGQLVIESPPGRGTHIVAEIPCG